MKSKNDDQIRRLLISGNDSELMNFNLVVCMVLNLIERRKQTLFYTCMKEDFDFAVKAAEELGVTAQELKHENGEEIYQIVVQGEHKGWEKKRKAEK